VVSPRGYEPTPPEDLSTPAHLGDESQPAHLAQLDLGKAQADVKREEARERLAHRLVYILVGLLATSFLFVGGILLSSIWTGKSDEQTEVDLLMRLLEVAFAPVVALVSGAVSFYYASRDR
jgi:hypothetical protein